MATNNVRTNKFGIPMHVGEVNKALLRKRIALISTVIESGRALAGKKLVPSGRKLSKKDLLKASLNLYTYRWQLKKMSAAKKSTKKRAS